MLSVQDATSIEQQKMAFSPSSTSSSAAHLGLLQPISGHSHLSFHGGMESGYASAFGLSRPLESFEVTAGSHNASITTTATVPPPLHQEQQQQHNNNNNGGQRVEVQTTPRTTAAINYMSALQLSTPRIGIRNGRKGTPLKRQQQIMSTNGNSCTVPYETTPKKAKNNGNSNNAQNENDENESSYVTRSGSAHKVPFRTRLSSAANMSLSPCHGAIDKLDCTFEAISSSTPICRPFRAEFYEQLEVEEIPQKTLLTRSIGKNTRTKLIRKMQSFSPRKLMGLRAAKALPLRERDQNSSVDFHSPLQFVVEEEVEVQSPAQKGNAGSVKKVLFGGGEQKTAGGAFSSGLRELMFGTIKNTATAETIAEEPEENDQKEEEGKGAKNNAEIPFESFDVTNQSLEMSVIEGHLNESVLKQEKDSSQLLDIYVTNLSNLDGGDSNHSHSAATEDGTGDVSMNSSMVADVERYFDELKRNTTQVQENANKSFVPLTAKDSMDLYQMLASDEDPVTVVDVDISPPLQRTETMGTMEMESIPVINKASPEKREKLCSGAALRKRKRSSTDQIHQAVMATPKKMRRSQSFAIGDNSRNSSSVYSSSSSISASSLFPASTDENFDISTAKRHSTDAVSGSFCIEESSAVAFPLSPSLATTTAHHQRLGGARKRLSYEAVGRGGIGRGSPAKKSLSFDGVLRRRSLTGTSRLNIFRHLANCPPVRDYFFQFVDDKDLVAIFAVSRQCRSLIGEHPRLNARRLKYLEAAWRKKENHMELSFTSFAQPNHHHQSPEDHSPRGIVEKSSIRIPLHNRNVDTSCASSINETMSSPPVSPSRRKFHENQKLVQRNPGAFFVSCPRCRSSSVIERPPVFTGTAQSHTGVMPEDEESSFCSFRSSKRSHSLCVSDSNTSGRNSSLMFPMRKQFSLPETTNIHLPKESGADQRMGVCQSIQCGFRFCVHCSYAYESGHKCIEIGTLSPLIKQSRQPRVVACSKQSKRNLKRL